MATRAFTVLDNNLRALAGQWTGLTQTTADDGSPVELPDYADRSVQVQGTFGVGGTLILEGSNDGSNWFQLTDPQGNNISRTAAGLEQIQEITRYVRPRVTAGDGTTSLTVIFYGVRK